MKKSTKSDVDKKASKGSGSQFKAGKKDQGKPGQLGGLKKNRLNQKNKNAF